jgi:sugar-phosphatase
VPADRWGVVTSAGRELARRRLSWAGITVPPILVTADDVRSGKPSPEGYLRGARALRVPATHCAVVEDSPAGVQAARAAGMTVVALTTTHGAGALSLADFCIKRYSSVSLRRRRSDLVLAACVGGAPETPNAR